MKIIYVTQSRFPTEKAHGYQVAEVCSAMSGLGHEVALVSPTVKTPITESPFGYYDVPENFQWARLKNFDALNAWFIPNQISFMISMHSYRKKLDQFFESNSADLLYCRSHVVLSPMLKTGKPVILELHTLPRHRRSRFVQLCNKCKRVVCLTSQMREELVSWGVDGNRVIVEGDAVRESALRDVSSLDDFQERLSGIPLIGYVGSLVARNTLSKGVEVLIEALGILKKQGLSFRGLIVGGPERWKKKYEDQARAIGLSSEDISFTGKVPASEVPSKISSCDVLIYPAPASNHSYYIRDTSPLKIFEYMASGRPIVAADIPPIRDILDEGTAVFCKPGDAESLADAVRKVLGDPEVAHQMACRARQHVEGYTWEKRVARILTEED